MSYVNPEIKLLLLEKNGKKLDNCIVIEQGDVFSLMYFKEIVLDFVPSVPDLCLYKGWKSSGECVNRVLFFMNNFTIFTGVNDAKDIYKMIKSGYINYFDGERLLYDPN